MRHYAIFLVFLISCQSDEELLHGIPFSIFKSSVHAQSDIRLFTQSGEIKDSGIIAAYLSKDSSTFNYYGRASWMYPSLDTVNFNTSNTAEVSGYYGPLACTYRQEQDLIVFTQLQEFDLCCSYGDVFSQSIAYQIVSVKPIILREYIKSSTGGSYSFGHVIKQRQMIKKVNKQWVAPWLIYARYPWGRNGGGVFDSTNNLLQADFYKSLAPGDTVSVRENMLFFDIKEK